MTNFADRIARVSAPPPRAERPAAYLVDRGSRDLVVTLPSSNGRGLLGELSTKFPGVDHLFLSCGDQEWMTQGVPLVTNSYYQTVVLLMELVVRYDRVVTVGSSCGGYLAINLGVPAGVHGVLAFDPHLIPIGPAREWIDPEQWRDCRTVLRGAAPSPPARVGVYHGQGEADTRKARSLAEVSPRVELGEIADAPGHGDALRVAYRGEGRLFCDILRGALDNR